MKPCARKQKCLKCVYKRCILRLDFVIIFIMSEMSSKNLHIVLIVAAVLAALGTAALFYFVDVAGLLSKNPQLDYAGLRGTGSQDTPPGTNHLPPVTDETGNGGEGEGTSGTSTADAGPLYFAT